ncbi:hypothetical protein AQUCO_01300382v1 [Aquilegia coerulea]|uniref:DUF4005 domain-containing protein n=1 Tax=Aquilegia coerulea TaxID=218851 RepID=A0A2G5E1A6_AQUCA|nr:hypothetical protein AQUCO_01300382v1 [Aquilegia coerulea]
MGKTARWFRGLLGGNTKKESSSLSTSESKPLKEKKRWSFVKSFRDKDRQQQQPPPTTVRRASYREGSSSSLSSTTNAYYEGVADPNKHAIAVAAATAAVAEAAVAAAQAAAAVVKLTSSGRCTTSAAYVSDNEMKKDALAAVFIQSAFRGYLARRALKALKGLVKLQALVRGHIMRKKTAEQMRCMQALARVQFRARASRTHLSEYRNPSIKSSTSHHPGPATPEKYERTFRSNSTRHDRGSPLKRNSSKSNSRDTFDWDKTQSGRSWDYYRETPIKYGTTDDEKSVKVLEIDPGKPHFNSKHRTISQSSQHAVVLDRLSFMGSPSKDSTTAHLSSSSPSSDEVQSRNPRRPPLDDDAFCTAQNSPQFYSTTSIGSKRGPFTPTKSDCSISFLSLYADHPNYMANTESSRAKVRSQSAPKQRLEFEKSSSARRYNVHGFGDIRPTEQRVSNLQSSFTSKAYPGSGRLDRLGMPIRQESVGFSGVLGNRY